MGALKKILIVDDDEALRQSLTEQLTSSEEFTAVEAATGAEAQAAARAENFDGVILDLKLPDMDGRDLCQLLRQAGLKAPIRSRSPAATWCT